MRDGIVVIGTSLGGLSALQTLLSGLPKDFPLPIAIVQHRSNEAETALEQILQRNCALPVIELQDKERMAPGCVYLAPPDYHLLVESEWFSLSTEGPISYARPSIDVLFESAAATFGEGVIGVVLTGANSDGARGAARVKQNGGFLIVQAPETAECGIMPRAAIAAAAPDTVLPLPGIASRLAALGLEINQHSKVSHARSR